MEAERAIEVISVDPGLTKHAICRLSSSGYKYEKLASGQWQKTPQFTILQWELWDLKNKIRYSVQPESWRVTTSKFENTGACVEQLYEMNHNLRCIVAQAQWLFEADAQGELPPLVSELQCGHIKNGEQDVYCIAHLLACEIYETDKRQGRTRRIVNGARKYGLPSDGKLKYDERKKRSVEITRALLRLTGKRDALTFLDLVWTAQKRDRPGKTPQEHDLCDALLLGLQYCTTEWEKREKARDNARPMGAEADGEAPPPLECINLFDSEEDAELKPRKPRRKPGEAAAAKPKKARKPK